MCYNLLVQLIIIRPLLARILDVGSFSAMSVTENGLSKLDVIKKTRYPFEITWCY